MWTAEPVCPVKHGEGLLTIIGLNIGADPELSLARPLSGDTHTGFYTHTQAHTYTPYKWVIKRLPLWGWGGGRGLRRFPSNHPSIHFLYRLIRWSGRGGLEPIPAVIGRKAGYTLDRSPVHHRAT